MHILKSKANFGVSIKIVITKFLEYRTKLQIKKKTNLVMKILKRNMLQYCIKIK